ncbi:neuromedin-S isoform X3 [Vulpes vulpes]|uniref:Neuromedin-S isoform X3 n=1 Tax=Vulpes vulpes TaxID=9627 RepID=A0ABM4Z517_VULVU
MSDLRANRTSQRGAQVTQTHRDGAHKETPARPVRVGAAALRDPQPARPQLTLRGAGARRGPRAPPRRRRRSSARASRAWPGAERAGAPRPGSAGGPPRPEASAPPPAASAPRPARPGMWRRRAGRRKPGARGPLPGASPPPPPAAAPARLRAPPPAPPPARARPRLPPPARARPRRRPHGARACRGRAGRRGGGAPAPRRSFRLPNKLRPRKLHRDVRPNLMPPDLHPEKTGSQEHTFSLHLGSVKSCVSAAACGVPVEPRRAASAGGITKSRKEKMALLSIFQTLPILLSY